MKRVPTLLLSCAAPLLLAGAALAQTPKSAWDAAAVRGSSAHARLEPDAGASKAQTLRMSRAAVAAYENIVRRYPRSGYSDNALWEGASLAADTWRRYGDDRDRAKAAQLLAWLQREYPASPLRPRAADALASLQRGTRVAPAKTSATGPAKAGPHGPRANTAAAPSRQPTSVAVGAGFSRPAEAATEVPDDYVASPGSTSAASPGRDALASVLLRAIREQPLPRGVRVTLEFDREIEYSERDVNGPPRLLLDLRDARPDLSLLGPMPFKTGLLRAIRVAPPDGDTTRVILELRGEARHSMFTLYNPFRLVIDVEQPDEGGPTLPAPAAAPPAVKPGGARSPVAAVPATAAPTIAPGGTAPPEPPLPSSTTAPPVSLIAPATPSNNKSGGFSLSRQLGLSVSRIVLDAGHGGHDPGARGRGLNESELVLDVARRLEKLLVKQPGIEVVMTRRADVFIPLPERTAVANRSGADLFLSIHANASPNPKARGIETYFLNFAPNPEAEAIAARENATSGQPMHALPDIVRAIALNNKIDESRDFAALVQDSLVGKLKGVRNLGVKQAPFVVLIGATMPSILAEISFITNRDDQALLKNGAHRQKIAEALYNGIMRYQRALKATAATAEQ